MKQIEKIETYGDADYHYSSGYFPDNKWLDNDTLLIQRCVNPTVGYDDQDEVEFLCLSLKDGKKDLICKDKVFAYFYFVFGTKLYYCDRQNLKVVDIQSKHVKTLYTYTGYQPGISKLAEPNITDDGKFICMRIATQNLPARIVVIEADTGREVYQFEAPFSQPFYAAEHNMICPTDPQLVYFCHEGTTQYISNRMWLYDARTGRKWNFAKQRLDENGNLGDCYGHEMWAPDGKGMYFVKYPCSTLAPSGVFYVDVQTGEQKAVATGYKYWHIAVSPDGKYLIGDTFEPNLQDKSETEVVMIDLADGSEQVVDIARTNQRHPAHPHPQLSPNSDRIIYNSLDESGRLTMKVVFLK